LTLEKLFSINIFKYTSHILSYYNVLSKKISNIHNIELDLLFDILIIFETDTVLETFNKNDLALRFLEVKHKDERKNKDKKE
jgi:hypothetical protein